MNDTITITDKPEDKIKRSWVPCALLLIHNKQVSTTLRFTPLHVSRDKEVTYKPCFRVYGDDPHQAAWESEGPSLGMESVYSLTSAEIAKAMGREELFHYAEDHHFIEQREPLDAVKTLGTYTHYYSTDGSMMGYLGGFMIYGASIKMLKGDFYYTNFPCVQMDDKFGVKIFILNPFTRPSPYSLIFIDRNGRQYETEPFEINGKSARQWSSKGVKFDGMEGPFGVVVKSVLKISSFFTSVNAENRMVSMEHGHPFFSYVLNHEAPLPKIKPRQQAPQ